MWISVHCTKTRNHPKTTTVQKRPKNA